METSEGTIIREAYSPGDYIFFEGDLESHFYIIEKGSVKIFTKNKANQRIDICTINEGESFGEFALLDKAPRSASAQAESDVVLIKVSQDGYEKLLEDLPVWSACMLRSFMARLKNMNALVKGMEQFLKKD